MSALIGWLRRGSRSLAVAAAVLSASALTTVLAMQVKALKEGTAKYREALAFPHAGQVVATVRAATLQGDSVTIGETAEGRSQVLVVFGTSCPYSQESMLAWKQLTAELLADGAGRHDVIWVSASSPDSTWRYVAEHELPAPVVLPPDDKMLPVYRILGSPMTLVLDHRGRITHARPGVLASPAAVHSILTAARQIGRPARGTVGIDAPIN